MKQQGTSVFVHKPKNKPTASLKPFNKKQLKTDHATQHKTMKLKQKYPRVKVCTVGFEYEF